MASEQGRDLAELEGERRVGLLDLHGLHRTEMQGIPGQRTLTLALNTNGFPAKAVLPWEDGRPSTCPPAPPWLPLVTIPLSILKK